MTGNVLGQPTRHLGIWRLPAEIPHFDIELLGQNVGELPFVECPRAHELLADAQAGLGLICQGLLELLVGDETLRDQEGAQQAPPWRGRLPARIARPGTGRGGGLRVFGSPSSQRAPQPPARSAGG